jgi:hypothetical protein
MIGVLAAVVAGEVGATAEEVAGYELATGGTVDVVA